MITGKRYKIAKRLGASVFDKTQGKKFALRMDAKKAGGKFKRAGSDFGVKLIEKQRAKVTYGVGEKQFKNSVQNILNKKSSNINEALVKTLKPDSTMLSTDSVLQRHDRQHDSLSITVISMSTAKDNQFHHQK